MMKHGILKKLKSQAGETIGETLVATLIAALALVMLAGAVTSAMRVVTRSNEALGRYYADNNALADRDTESDVLASDVTITVSGLSPDDSEYAVNCWVNEQLSGKPVIAYAMPVSTPEP